jgi:hypothetical protein
MPTEEKLLTESNVTSLNLPFFNTPKRKGQSRRKKERICRQAAAENL